MPPRYLNDITIPEGETESAVVDLRAAGFQYADGLLIVAPALLEVVTVHAAARADGTFAPLLSNGDDVALVAERANPLFPIKMIGALKLVADGAVAEDRVFEVSASDTRR